MKLKEIIALKSPDVSALYARGVVGDDDAMNDYVRWCIWRTLDQRIDMKKAEKVKAFASFVDCVSVAVDRG